jgi:hypothetical protein
MCINTVVADLSISKQGTVFYLQMHAQMSVCLLIPWRRTIQPQSPPTHRYTGLDGQSGHAFNIGYSIAVAASIQHSCSVYQYLV